MAPSFSVRPRAEARDDVGIEGEPVRDGLARGWLSSGLALQVIFNRTDLAAMACAAGNWVNELRALWVLPQLPGPMKPPGDFSCHCGFLRGTGALRRATLPGSRGRTPDTGSAGLHVAAYSQGREQAGQEAKGRDPTAPPGVSCFCSLRVNVTSPSHPFSTR